MNSTAVPDPHDPAPVEAPDLSCDEVSAWLDEVLAILEATSVVAPFGSVGLQRWALDQLTAIEAVLPWLVSEVAEADIESARFQEAGWMLVRAEAVTSKLQAHLSAKPHAA